MLNYFHYCNTTIALRARVLHFQYFYYCIVYNFIEKLIVSQPLIEVTPPVGVAKSGDSGVGHKSPHTTWKTQYTVDQYPEPLHTMTAMEAMVSVQFMLIIYVVIMDVL